MRNLSLSWRFPDYSVLHFPFILCKGLIYYLPKDKVTQLLDFVSECAQGWTQNPPSHVSKYSRSLKLGGCLRLLAHPSCEGWKGEPCCDSIAFSCRHLKSWSLTFFPSPCSTCTWRRSSKWQENRYFSVELFVSYLWMISCFRCWRRCCNGNGRSLSLGDVQCWDRRKGLGFWIWLRGQEVAELAHSRYVIDVMARERWRMQAEWLLSRLSREERQEQVRICNPRMQNLTDRKK